MILILLTISDFLTIRKLLTQLNQNGREYFMTQEKFQYIKNVWIEGNNILCLGIPSEIVKKLNLNQDSYLLVELFDDSIIVIKKVNPQFSKDEINKVTASNMIAEKSVEKKQSEEEFDNPLKDLNL